jgi:hypothetical protein
VLDNNDNTNIDKCEQSGDHSLPGFVCQRVATPLGDQNGVTGSKIFLTLSSIKYENYFN